MSDLAIDPLVKLAIALRTKPGSYALLLGSGVSARSGILSGWNVLLSLIRQIAAVQGEDAGDNPEIWYQEKYGEAPDYSILLEKLTQEPAERSLVLRDFIEPNPEERELELKQPTDAHRVIAELVSRGYIRVIATTNFDKLLELALGELGIVPTVIASESAAETSLPFAYNNCTIIKLNGDYLDTTIRNTPSELEAYGPETVRVLEKMLSECGLVVCGWSAAWDTALVQAVASIKSRWFGTYWNSYREPGGTAIRLIEQRKAEVIANMDADTFFTQLADNIRLLEMIGSQGEVTVALVRDRVKRFVDDPTKRVQLWDLAVREGDRLRKSIEEEFANYSNTNLTAHSITEQLTRFENQTEVFREILATGCYFGKTEHQSIWVDAIDRLAAVPEGYSSSPGIWERLLIYPMVLAIYSAGIACIASANYSTLAQLLYNTSIYDNSKSKRIPLILKATNQLIPGDFARRHWPKLYPAAVIPAHLYDTHTIWKSVREYVPQADLFKSWYERFEYLLGMAFIHIESTAKTSYWPNMGILAFRDHGAHIDSYAQVLKTELEKHETDWPPIPAGMFGGYLNWGSIPDLIDAYTRNLREARLF